MPNATCAWLWNLAKKQAVANHYLEAITATCDLNSFHGLSQLLGANDSELDAWIERAEQETLDRWWAINDVVPPQAGKVYQLAAAKSTLDDLLDDLPPGCVDMQYAQVYSLELHPALYREFRDEMHLHLANVHE